MLFTLLFSCTDASNLCATAHDNVCDELSSCALGTDSSDCDSACESTPWSPDIAGAAMTTTESCRLQRDDGAGTEGTGGKAGTLMALFAWG